MLARTVGGASRRFKRITPAPCGGANAAAAWRGRPKVILRSSFVHAAAPRKLLRHTHVHIISPLRENLLAMQNNAFSPRH